MQRASFTQSLARASARRPWWTVGLWIVGLIVALVLTATILDTTAVIDFTSNPDSKRANELVEQRLGRERQSREIIIVRSAQRSVDDAAFRAFVNDLHVRVTALGPEIVLPGSSTTFYASGDASLVSQDRRTTIIPLVMAGDLEAASDNIEKVQRLVEQARDRDGFQVYLTGTSSIGLETTEVAEQDLIKGEIFGIAVALVILVLVFGAVVAALLPIIIGMLSIFIAIGIAAIVSQGFELSFFVTNMITLIGLAVGVDYCLFIVHRFREERRRGRTKEEAIAMTGSTAGRTVFYSGLTVVLALIGMVIVPTTIFQSLGLGAILVVIVAVLASMTLLPALLSILGDRINLLSIPLFGRGHARIDEERPGGFWDRTARVVMRQPLISLVVSAGLLIALAVPYFSLNSGFVGIQTLPENLQSRQGFLILDQEFSTGRITPAEVVVDGPASSPAVQGGIERLKGILAGDPAFATPFPLETNAAGDLALLQVPVNGEPVGDQAIAAIKRLRRQYIPRAFDGVPAEVLVTGETAFNTDFFRLTSDITPAVFAFVLGFSFLLLMLVFRSIVVPLKAILLNMLSVGAAYGLLVLVFQKGWAHSLFGFQQVDTVEAWVPLFLFSILFGLSMDYHVFLLSRIRERYDQTGENTGSVAFGIRSTGRLITGAALIMVAVFSGFASGDLVMFQQMGFGLAIAVLLDATIVRMVLVPSSMQLLGRVNWYFPKALRWLPDVRVETERPEPARAMARETTQIG